MNQASSFQCLLVNFSAMFTCPSLWTFMTLTCGFVLCTGRRTISRVIQLGCFAEGKRHHSIFYRFFSRAVWLPNELGKRVFHLALELGLLPENMRIILTVDDTLCRKSGAHIWGGGMHHDALLSNYGRGKSLVKFFSFGHNWVIVCVCIRTPWKENRWMAVPIAFRLYRSKKRCPKEQYRKRTQLAREMMEEMNTWLPRNRAVILVGDTEYACREVVRGLPRIEFVGPMNMDAALFEPPPANVQGRGRPRKKGRRLLSPKQLIAAEHIPWEPHEMLLYGRTVTVLVKNQLCLWYTVAGGRLVRMIVTRDPSGRIEDRAYFSTDAEMSVEELAQSFSLRWTQEEMHRNVKQYLGLEDPQNGWWRRPRGRRRNEKIPGPRPHKKRGEKAVTRTVPFILTIYALVVLWYFGNGSAREDVERTRRLSPWYREKTEPSFSDMLAALRRELWAERNFSAPSYEQGSSKINAALLEWLCAA